MKRFASHYLYVPEYGLLKQWVVEMTDEGYASAFFSLTEEIESVEWFPGVIVLASEVNSNWEYLYKELTVAFNSTIKEMADMKSISHLKLSVYLLYPFDFISMQPVAGTQRKQLL